ncbi:MAG: MerR family transcriptional regulator [Bacteroidetes bacterium]|jgi:transcriptional regulator with XRE-family HTH domain|nr:MerR family transcriptional regulator [Bacteroidota bacterium]
MNRIGERVKRKRELLGMQLNDLAKKVGISSSALSQIEKAKSYPSILTLKLIAENLYTTVGELIGENESLFNNPVFRSEDMGVIEVNDSGTQMFMLSQHDASKQMDTFLLKFPGGSDSVGLFKQHTGQIFAYLLRGELQFEIDNRSYVILPGDTIYFNGKRNFRIQNIIQDISELLCVTIPHD